MAFDLRGYEGVRIGGQSSERDLSGRNTGMYVCTYVCMYVCLYVCRYVCLRDVFMYVCMYAVC
jgi:hypothetical protein